MGQFSTPVVHAFAWEGRYVRSYEHHPFWFEKICQSMDYPHEHDHEWFYVDDWDKAVVEDRQWDVAIVDHEIDRRATEIMRLKGHCRFLVCHDAYNSNDYGYYDVFPEFAHVVRDDTPPHPAVISDESLDFLVEFLKGDYLEWQPR